MNKEIIRDEQLGEQYSVIHHKSGLDILVWEMEGYRTTSAMFATKYGSFNNIFKTAGQKEYTTVPMGIAHFLEHKLFENEDCTAFALFARTGASANAYTTFDHTAYYYNCSQNWEQSLEILLDFVQKPYFTQETIDKELGIIGQEIRMGLDSPDRKCFYDLIKALYSEHPIKIDIVGTEESIAQITPELLYECYNNFYDLHNMFLAVAGNVDEDKVIEIADRLLRDCEDKQVETFIPNEPREVCMERIESEFEVGLPIFNIGFKALPLSGEERLKAGVTSAVMLELLSGTMSPLYKELLDLELINSTFCYDLMLKDGVFFLSFVGESEEPDRVREYIVREIERVKEEGFEQKRFDIVRKSIYGQLIREFTNPERVCADFLASSALDGVDSFAQMRAFRALTAEDCRKALADYLDPRYSAISIVRPKTRKE
ncbi:MAG: insulinase family protein [Ruminococcus sp.]|nr:insulinase family protein [Ruminococcus sp.]